MPDSGRVIAGTAGGLRLVSAGPGTRPLADRVKQTLFAILEPDLAGARFLDLFAGSGAAGIEALSRGAARAVFVDAHPSAIRAVEENLRRTGQDPSRAAVVRGDALSYLRRRGADDGPFDVAFVDPPYAEHDMLFAALAILGGDGQRDEDPRALLAPGARVVAKHFWRDRPPPNIGLLASERERRFGETALTFYRAGPRARPTPLEREP